MENIEKQQLAPQSAEVVLYNPNDQSVWKFV